MSSSCFRFITGPTGPTGDVGDRGDSSGDIGPTGPPGLKGPLGYIGNTGDVGVTGSKGKMGSLITAGKGSPLTNPTVEAPVLSLDTSTNDVYYFGGSIWVKYLNISGSEGHIGSIGPTPICNNQTTQSQDNITLMSIRGYTTTSSSLVKMGETIIIPNVGPEVSIVTSWNFSVTPNLGDTLIRVLDIVRYGVGYDSSTEVIISDRRQYIRESINNMSYTNTVNFYVPSTAYNLYFTPFWSVGSGVISNTGVYEGYTIQVISR